MELQLTTAPLSRTGSRWKLWRSAWTPWSPKTRPTSKQRTRLAFSGSTLPSHTREHLQPIANEMPADVTVTALTSRWVRWPPGTRSVPKRTRSLPLSTPNARQCTPTFPAQRRTLGEHIVTELCLTTGLLSPRSSSWLRCARSCWKSARRSRP